jgi:hypothetical protein
MTAFPQSLDALTAAGYVYSGSAHCRKCNGRILWYKTPVNAKLMPMNPDGTTHWATCPNAKDFKKGSK